MTDAAAASGSAGPSSVPSTLLTFLLADIRGYTRFSAEQGDRAAGALSERFLALCREIMDAHGGDVFSTAGDQAVAAFPSAHAALRGALALQARLAERQDEESALPWLAGIGLDTGEGIRIGGDYRSNAINLAARLCSLAGPGEIFASDTVITVAHVLEDIALVDRGEVTLKGIAHPVRVIQLFPEGTAPGELPPLQPILVTQPTNLPDPPTPFIGRSAELTQLTALLGTPGVRLVTLTGPGGTGKTRLALQVGSSLLHAYRDGVFFCDLSPLTDPALVPSTVAGVVGVQEEPGRSVLDSISDHLKEKHLLLVLDNCEQVREAASEIALLLDRCRELSVLATSRIPLHLSREREYAVKPLPVPDVAQLPPLDQLSQYDAVALFIQRAVAVKADFAITSENAPAVAEICARLDGLPLAIELAASRSKVFPPQALLQRLDRRLSLLTGGPRDLPTRQQTLRQTIAWSYSLLSEQEQVLFARLAVFAGGCTIEAAEAVCDPAGQTELLEGLTSLVDKSLLRQEGKAESRVTMLETIREYARERLAERGEETGLRTAHATYFTTLVKEAEPALTGPEQVVWLARLDEEHDNLRAALDWTLTGRSQLGPRLAAALWRFWYIRGHLTEGCRWLEAAIVAGGGEEDRALRARLLNGAGVLAMRQGDYERASELHEESLQLHRELRDKGGIARSLGNLGGVAVLQGNYERAKTLQAESLHLFRELGDRSGIARSLINLGAVAERQGDYERARTSLEESVQLFRDLGDKRGMALAFAYLGSVAEGQGDLERARDLHQESLLLMREVGDKGGMAAELVGLASVAEFSEKHERATRVLAAANVIWTYIGGAAEPTEKERIERISQAARSALGDEGFEQAWKLGRAMTLDDAVAYALHEGRHDGGSGAPD